MKYPPIHFAEKVEGNESGWAPMPYRGLIGWDVAVVHGDSYTVTRGVLRGFNGGLVVRTYSDVVVRVSWETIHQVIYT